MQQTSCKTITARFSALLDGELSPDEQAVVHAHLSHCPACRDEWATLRRTQAVLAAWQAPAVNPQLSVVFAERLQTRARPRPALPRWGWALGMGLLLATGGILRHLMAPPVTPVAMVHVITPTNKIVTPVIMSARTSGIRQKTIIAARPTENNFRANPPPASPIIITTDAATLVEANLNETTPPDTATGSAPTVAALSPPPVKSASELVVDSWTETDAGATASY